MASHVVEEWKMHIDKQRHHSQLHYPAVELIKLKILLYNKVMVQKY